MSMIVSGENSKIPKLCVLDPLVGKTGLAILKNEQVGFFVLRSLVVVSENILVRSHKSFRNKEERRSYMVSVVREILGNLQKCMKSKKKLMKLTKGIACYTYTYMQLYTLCAGWLYLFGNDSS